MKYIIIHTFITVKNDDDTTTEYKAMTDVNGTDNEKENIKSALDIHNEKVGSLERKLLK